MVFSDEYLTRIQRELYDGLENINHTIRVESDFPRTKISNKDIWGREVVRVKDNKIVDRNDLELWAITSTFPYGTNANRIYDELLHLALAKEVANCPNGHIDGRDCTCYMLGEWLWLDDNKGRIVRKTETSLGPMYSATLVTYAKILPDLEAKDE